MTTPDGSRAPKPAGETWGVGLALGTGVGVALGTALGNVALGIAIGVAIGLTFALAFGNALAKRRSDDATDAVDGDDPEPPTADPR